LFVNGQQQEQRKTQIPFGNDKQENDEQENDEQEKLPQHSSGAFPFL
jgi:hypothetical protein